MPEPLSRDEQARLNAALRDETESFCRPSRASLAAGYATALERRDAYIRDLRVAARTYRQATPDTPQHDHAGRVLDAVLAGERLTAARGRLSGQEATA